MEEIQEIELLKAEDGLGFNIRGGKDAEYVREDNGIFVTKIRERGSAARLLAAGDRPCLHEGDKLLEIDGNSLTNIDHNEAVNLFVTSGSVVKLKFVPGAYQKIIHQREIMQERDIRKKRMWTISMSVVGLVALGAFVLNGRSRTLSKLFSLFRKPIK
jgi:C-terminal processing protease CtpA/Prc